MKHLTIAGSILFVCFGLWSTSPDRAILKCEKVNTPEICAILNAE